MAIWLVTKPTNVISSSKTGLSAIVKIAVIIVICTFMTIPLFYYSEISEHFRLVIILLMYSVPILYMLLFFLDPGTVFDHEEETFSEERIYCLTCEIYRNISTKHCSFCNRCCKKYDHHCSVFGKCIGKRNLLIFYLFIINTAMTFVLYFIASIG